jgi:hypothetical protein
MDPTLAINDVPWFTRTSRLASSRLAPAATAKIRANLVAANSLQFLGHADRSFEFVSHVDFL